MRKVTFNTQPYENSHGKRPRGTGMWWFEDENCQQYNGAGSYTETKNAVKKEAQQNGATELKVLP